MSVRDTVADLIIRTVSQVKWNLVCWWHLQYYKIQQNTLKITGNMYIHNLWNYLKHASGDEHKLARCNSLVALSRLSPKYDPC
ncbi:hypothetical protein MK131_17085 [Candidatus Poribacteria bacterium]|nr:hypothetical protein [Candidatus Poribacteria bacterium]